VLDVEELRGELIRSGSLWQEIEVVAESPSTNAELAAAAQRGEPAGRVLITEHQSAGRGRRGRTWTAPAGSGIAMSVLLRPVSVDQARWSWLPLLAGLAVADGLRSVADVPAVLKWPNDVLVGERKVCGILAERVDTRTGPACVVGMGINIGLTAEELPVPTATSLAILLSEPNRVNDLPSPTAVAATVLAVLELVYLRWESSGGGNVAASYTERCDTIGRRVRVVLSDQHSVEGVAEAVDADGRLVVRTTTGVQVFSAGDVVHLRN
jgi:BirA family transcriptional regulator, biotin operon repressor / biotin---[acetyl-CoA-carboxylase] ligase